MGNVNPYAWDIGDEGHIYYGRAPFRWAGSLEVGRTKRRPFARDAYMKIPVFVSCPTTLNAAQEASREAILAELDKYGLEPRALGRSDYPVDTPLKEVLVLARHCSGGLILGFSQLFVVRGRRKPGTTEESPVSSLQLPTPWNQLEAGILFGLGLPLLVFCETGVSGGVFDVGTGDLFVHRMPTSGVQPASIVGLQEVFLRWQARVREHYYRL